MAMTTTLLLVVAVIITLFLVVVVVIIMTVLRTKDATVHKPIPVSDEGRQGTARAVSLTVPSRGQQRFNSNLMCRYQKLVKISEKLVKKKESF